MIAGVVVAHPDDEVLTCGGTIAKLTGRGDVVHTLILGTGAMAREGATQDDVERLRLAAHTAGEILGAATTTLLAHPDNAFDSVPLLVIVRDIERWLRDALPDVILTQSPGCLNVDHRLTCQAVVTATRPGTSTVRAVYAGETPSATEWSFAEPVWRPTRYEALTRKHLGRRLDALVAYEREMRGYPHARSTLMWEALAMRRGAEAGVELAEAFVVLRETVL